MCCDPASLTKVTQEMEMPFLTQASSPESSLGGTVSIVVEQVGRAQSLQA